MNNQEYMNTLIDFIKNTEYVNLSKDVQKQAKKCFFDLSGVICCGAKNNSAKKAAKYVTKNYPTGRYSILATGDKTNLIGAALANGMAANALDMDDGYSLLRGHPGAGFFGALLSAAEGSECTYGEFRIR
ncbi:MmgE/PrpD family protein [Faecalicatena contorta]|uniref:MmgE/PrpD family protein n=1 Tax=Faecalicatena contorta TaxID=39482 RepID=UPI001896CEDF|nr:MmgE/PrpD family protein [Faecalicatena contorta]